MDAQTLVGVGLYTPSEAGRLIGVQPQKIIRWLRGHAVGGKHYDPLWKPQIDLEDGHTYISFRDMLEARVAAELIKAGISPQKLRRAIDLATEVMGERPLATQWLKTDGKSVFLQIAKDNLDEEPECLDLFKKQYAFPRVVKDSLRDIEFDGNYPAKWWPRGQKAGILIDPERSFGKPIEQETSVPAEQLANAVKAEGSIEKAAKAWSVPVKAVRKAVAFQEQIASAALAA